MDVILVGSALPISKVGKAVHFLRQMHVDLFPMNFPLDLVGQYATLILA